MSWAESKSCDVYAVSDPGHHDLQTMAHRILGDLRGQTEEHHVAPEMFGLSSKASGAVGVSLLIANVVAGEACRRNGSCGLIQGVTRCKPRKLLL